MLPLEINDTLAKELSDYMIGEKMTQKSGTNLNFVPDLKLYTDVDSGKIFTNNHYWSHKIQDINWCNETNRVEFNIFIS